MTACRFYQMQITTNCGDVLLVCKWRHGGHVGGQEQKHFSPLGNELYFDANLVEKYSFVLTTNMAALSRGCNPRI